MSNSASAAADEDVDVSESVGKEYLSSRKEELVNVSKDQIIQLLESQGKHDQAQQAGKQLPDQVDTDNSQHADLLSKLGLDSGGLGAQLGGLGKIL